MADDEMTEEERDERFVRRLLWGMRNIHTPVDALVWDYHRRMRGLSGDALEREIDGLHEAFIALFVEGHPEWDTARGRAALHRQLETHETWQGLLARMRAPQIQA